MRNRFRHAAVAALFVVVGTQAWAQQGPSSTTIIQACRLYDSRLLPEGEPLKAGVTYQIQARGSCNIPESANAIMMTVTAVGAGGEGYLRIWPSDLLEPTAVTLTYSGDAATSSAAISRLCAPPLNECSEVDLSIRPSFQDTHVVIDIAGYAELIADQG